MAGKKAFVTGGTGYLGYHVISRLLAEGWAVEALYREGSDRRPLRDQPIVWHRGDITDRASLLAALPEGVDVVFHIAADLSRWARHNARQTRTNVEGTRNMVEAALARGAGRFLLTSSIAAYGLQEGRVTEKSPRRGGRSWINYQRSKFRAEQILHEGQERGLDAVTLNIAHVIGSHDRHGWAGLIEEVCHAKVLVVPPGAGSFAGAPEVAEAHVRAAERGRRGESYLLGGVDLSYLELTRMIAGLCGRRPPARPLPAWLLSSAARIYGLRARLTRRRPRVTPEEAAPLCLRLFCDSGKAARDLDYRPAPLAERIEESFAWLKEQGVIRDAG